MTKTDGLLTAAAMFKTSYAALDGTLPQFFPESVQGSDDQDDDILPAGRQRLRAVFISDLHIGTPGFQAEALLDFLKHHPSDVLYLVGDIVDGWQLRRRWFWPQSHNDVVQKLLRRARKGCRVIYVPGNHDEFARHFVGHAFGGVEVLHDTSHTTAKGLKLWVVHGDHFDGVIQCAKWLAYVGDYLYELTLRLNRHLNSFRARIGLEAKRRGFDGVVCGHIHHAEIRDVNGTLYCNDGDWVESRTALVEHADGRLEIIHWAGQAVVVNALPVQAVPA